MDNNRRFYDLEAEEYANEWYSNETILPSIKEYLGLFKCANPKILDLGCGPGHESKRLQENGAQVVGIDFSSNSIQIAKQRNDGIKFYEMDYFEITSELGMFNGIFSCSSIIHLQKEELFKVIQISSSVLQENGLFLVIYRKGSGRITQNHEICGEKIIRTIEQYEQEDIKKIFRKNKFDFLQEGFLDNALRPNWDSVIFIKR